jgi:DoxX-like family
MATPVSDTFGTAVTVPSPAPPGAAQRWAGRVLTALPALAMLASGGAKVAGVAAVVDNFRNQFGFPDGVLTWIGLVELACAVVYLVPRTAVLGAVLITGYFGGAVCTHVRSGLPWILPFLVAVMAWAGLYLRDARVRALLPLRR